MPLGGSVKNVGKKMKWGVPSNDGLGLDSPSHEKVNHCSLLIYVGLGRPPGIYQAELGVLVASFLVLFCACIIDVGKGLAGVHDDEGG